MTEPAIQPPPGDGATTTDKGRAYGIAAGELLQFVEQFEQLEAEKQDVGERQKELMAEARARGYDTKVLRKRDKDDIAEEEAILEMYLAALGM